MMFFIHYNKRLDLYFHLAFSLNVIRTLIPVKLCKSQKRQDIED